MKERERKTAQQFNILDKMEKLEKDLLSIDGVTEVDFDLSGFYDDMNEVIFLTKYEISADTEDYFNKRKKLIADVIKVAQNHGLTRTEDRIEDYGEHFYFVMKCKNGWQ